MRRLSILALLLASCTDPCQPLTVETNGLSRIQHDEVIEAVNRWNRAAGFDVLELVKRDGDLVVSGKTPRGGAYISTEGDVIAMGSHEDGNVYPVEHELGRALGLPDDQLPTSIMNPGPATDGSLILPEHVAQLQSRAQCDGP